MTGRDNSKMAPRLSGTVPMKSDTSSAIEWEEEKPWKEGGCFCTMLSH